ncbi:MAG: class I SAM-dependent methyltransferase, partial [Burkholderiales bacterium]|nr:class I SAM-dependent methyltransferase [Burkholderiales bacterium]
MSVEEAPYVQTPPHLVRRLLQLGDLRAGEMLWDLGSGDGRIVLAAARDFGARGVGYDIDASLVAGSRASAHRARLAGRAKFFERDVLTLDFSGPAAPDVVTLYLLPELNLALKPKLLGQLRPGARVLSVDWDMGADWPADETLIVPYAAKPHGRERSYRLMLWVVPAKVAGRWRVALDTGTLLPRHAGTRGGPEQAAHAALD